MRIRIHVLGEFSFLAAATMLIAIIAVGCSSAAEPTSTPRSSSITQPTSTQKPVVCNQVDDGWQSWMFNDKQVDLVSAVALTGQVTINNGGDWKPAANPATGFVWYHFIVAAKVDGADSPGLWLVHHIDDDDGYSSFPVNEEALVASDVGSGAARRTEVRYTLSDGESAVGCLNNAQTPQQKTVTIDQTEEQQILSAACDDAWKEAAAIDNMSDTVEDLDPAVVACKSLDEWNIAANRYPAALDGADSVLYLSNRCYFGPKSATICKWLIANPSFIHPSSILGF